MAADTIMGPVHPGEILLEEFLKPLSVSQYHLAKEIGVPARRVNEIVHGQRRISADTALRLARFFGTSERFWINLQSRYDLEVEKDRLGDGAAACPRELGPDIGYSTRELRTHLRGALRLGVTPAELAEIFIQVGGYAGSIRAGNAFLVTAGLLAESLGPVEGADL